MEQMYVPWLQISANVFSLYRTPLTVTMIGLGLSIEDAMNRKSQVLESQLETLQDCLSSAEMAMDILNDILLMDKVDLGKLILEREVVEVVPLLRSAFLTFTLSVSSITYMYIEAMFKLTFCFMYYRQSLKKLNLIFMQVKMSRMPSLM